MQPLITVLQRDHIQFFPPVVEYVSQTHMIRPNFKLIFWFGCTRNIWRWYQLISVWSSATSISDDITGKHIWHLTAEESLIFKPRFPRVDIVGGESWGGRRHQGAHHEDALQHQQVHSHLFRQNSQIFLFFFSMENISSLKTPTSKTSDSCYVLI